MPFKSEAQRRKFAELVKQKKMDQSTFNEWNEATKGKLPERLPGPKQKVKIVKTPLRKRNKY
jgi:hypothetical protein